MHQHRVYGIRHHGPGSSRALLKALEVNPPDLLLIEGPPDANPLIEYLGNPDLIPPVALLLYNPKDLNQAVYYPFAEFSPEWQAMKFGIQNEIAVQFMDLPQSIHFGLNQLEKDAIQIQIEKKDPEKKEVDPQLLRDPIGVMANLAGYEDSERWWEITFEQSEGHEATFDAILDMMTAMRDEVGNASPRRELLREAFMRKTIRDAIKKGFQNIAIVCGAWHAPVLEQVHTFKASTDNAVLRGLKKIKTSATWIPWTYDRLARQSGYSAGVNSPAWYELLFSKRKEVVNRWMSKAARLLREEDIAISSAHSIEAVRLANTLAALRELSIPGINELYEAAHTVFGEGAEARMDLIKTKLVVGDVVGQVPDEIPVIPLQQDLEKAIKTARLTKERNTSESMEKKLDLRKPANLFASQLLHRLLVLKLPWGTEAKVSQYNTGSFTENWVLKWKPDFIIKVIEAGMWGNTVEEAATKFVQNHVQDIRHIAHLTVLLERVLKAQLPKSVFLLIQKLQDLATLTKDVFHLMDALSPLVQVLRYGSTRQLDNSSVEGVIQHIVPRICVGLPNACIGIDEEVSESVFHRLLKCNQALSILNNASYLEIWTKTLEQIATTPAINGRLQGACTRILMDKKIYNIAVVSRQMRYALSKGNQKQEAAFWLEGFLHGSGLLLIHNPKLWQVLDEWIEELAMDDLLEILPLLRRTFSSFSDSERRKMMALAKTETLPPTANKPSNTIHIEEERAKRVLPTIALLLGKGGM